MKISWKIFTITTFIMVIMFGVFGSSMQYMSFQDAFNYEVAQGYSDIKTFQMTLETMTSSLKENQWTGSSLEDIVVKIQARMPEADLSIGKTAEGDGKGGIGRKSKKKDAGQKGTFYELKNNHGSYVLCYTMPIEIEGKQYILGNDRNIDKIYEERSRMYRSYLALTAIMTVVGGVLLFSVSRHLTRNIRLLGNTTRNFAGGEYSERSQIKSRDEIGELAEDFNEMAERLEGNIEELKESVRRREDFTSAFSHELKTPMTSIIGYADMMRSMKLEEEEIIEFSDYIYHQGKRLEKLSHSMLSLMEIERNPLTCSRLSVPVIVKEALKDVKPLLQEAGIHFRVKIMKGYICGNEELLIMVIRNVLDNARKASKEGGSITVSGSLNSGKYVLSVKDNGCGIPTEELGRITEAFYMVDKSRARKQGGAGLGLSLVDKIVKIHGGELRIESREGAGTLVTIILPTEEQKVKEQNQAGGYKDEA